MRAVRAVIRKELLDALRDRRSLLSALVFPLVGPLLIGLMLAGVSKTVAGDDTDPLPVRGRDHAPELVAYLEQSGFDIGPAPNDAERAVREGDEDIVLIIPEGYGPAIRAGESATLRLVLDRSRTAGAGRVRRVRATLQAWGARMAAFRLLARGVHPELIAPLEMDIVDLATPEKHSANILAVVPIFVILSLFIGGMHVAIDTTAGERERGSIEPLLLNPVSREALIAGKWAVTVLFSLISAILTLLFSVLVLAFVPLEELGVTLRVGPAEIALLLLATLPLAPLASAVQLWVATFARSFKEAQTYLSLLLFLPMIPGVVSSVLPLRAAWWMYPVPALAQQTLVTDVLRGEPASALAFAAAALSSLALAALCVWATARAFRRERIIFSGQ